MSFFNVSPKKERELMERMKQLNVSEDDIEERFSRSSGPGGQKTNKTSTCVFLRHTPTGITVKCQEERSQSLNRFFARRRLLDQVERSKKGLLPKKKSVSIRSDNRKEKEQNELKKKYWPTNLNKQ